MLIACTFLNFERKGTTFWHIGTRNKVEYAHFTDFLHFKIYIENIRYKISLAFWLDRKI